MEIIHTCWCVFYAFISWLVIKSGTSVCVMYDASGMGVNGDEKEEYFICER